jgi:hypothetical protein
MAQAPRIGVDPRIGLMSILFRLAGNNEYTQGRVPGYLQAIDRHFQAHRDHEAVQLARELRNADGVSFDAVISLNWPGGGSFASEEGALLKPVPISFRTRAATSSPMRP